MNEWQSQRPGTKSRKKMMKIWRKWNQFPPISLVHRTISFFFRRISELNKSTLSLYLLPLWTIKSSVNNVLPLKEDNWKEGDFYFPPFLFFFFWFAFIFHSSRIELVYDMEFSFLWLSTVLYYSCRPTWLRCNFWCIQRTLISFYVFLFWLTHS